MLMIYRIAGGVLRNIKSKLVSVNSNLEEYSTIWLSKDGFENPSALFITIIKLISIGESASMDELTLMASFEYDGKMYLGLFHSESTPLLLFENENCHAMMWGIQLKHTDSAVN